VDVV
jgi:hypothetical protein